MPTAVMAEISWNNNREREFKNSMAHCISMVSSNRHVSTEVTNRN